MGVEARKGLKKISTALTFVFVFIFQTNGSNFRPFRKVKYSCNSVDEKVSSVLSMSCCCQENGGQNMYSQIYIHTHVLYLHTAICIVSSCYLYLSRGLQQDTNIPHVLNHFLYICEIRNSFFYNILCSMF